MAKGGDLFGWVRSLLPVGEIDYARAKDLARHKNARVRAKLAENHNLEPAILYFLAEDSAPEVRAQIAANKNAPPQADLLLARDDNSDVREALAVKISKLAPGLNRQEVDKVQGIAYEILQILAQDQAVRVRQVLSESLKDMVDAPEDIILQLARDVELVVSGPVLEFSPILNDEDLLEIIKSRPPAGVVNAIARRKSVSERTADAVWETGEEDAICALLTNGSAQIREETLDKIIDHAPGVLAWHQPLVHRPHLLPGMAERLAVFVSDTLLENLLARADLNSEGFEKVRAEVHRRLSNKEQGLLPSNANMSQDALVRSAQELMQQGKLGNTLLLDALNSGQIPFVKAALSVRAGLEMTVVDKMVESQSAKAIVALAWKADVPADTAIIMQRRLARILPREVIRDEAGHYTLGEQEMRWQIDFFKELAV